MFFTCFKYVCSCSLKRIFDSSFKSLSENSNICVILVLASVFSHSSSKFPSFHYDNQLSSQTWNIWQLSYINSGLYLNLVSGGLFYHCSGGTKGVMLHLFQVEAEDQVFYSVDIQGIGWGEARSPSLLNGSRSSYTPPDLY
jgi:hypothetical protein